MNDINSKLLSEQYQFLRTHPDLQQIIYLTLSGSHGYGTNNAYSDIDLRGCLIERPQYLFGLQSFEQFEELETDTVIYGLKKFVKLCVEANPNALELLGTEEKDIVVMTEQGRRLREHAHLFLSKRVIQSFGNYATAQLRRLQNALCHDQYLAQEQERHLKNTLQTQLLHFQENYRTFPGGAIALSINQEKQEIEMDIHLEKYPLRDFVNIYSEMSNTVKTYSKLNHRNRKKDDLHLYKHAMHLIRLLITGMDILDGKGIVTKRTVEHDFLMEIRNGHYSYEKLFALAEAYQSKFDQSAKRTMLPEKVDLEKIEALMMEIYQCE